MLSWQCLPFPQLDGLTVYKILALRSEVFVVEQTCIYQDIDDKDQKAMHLMGWQEDELMAYLRILPATATSNLALGRVIVRDKARGLKIGDRLLEQGLHYCQQWWPKELIHISAQQHLADFYQSHGFQVVGDPYLEDGIPHIGMDRPSFEQ